MKKKGNARKQLGVVCTQKAEEEGSQEFKTSLTKVVEPPSQNFVMSSGVMLFFQIQQGRYTNRVTRACDNTHKNYTNSSHLKSKHREVHTKPLPAKKLFTVFNRVLLDILYMSHA